MTAPDLLDFSFAIECARLDAKHIARKLRDADERGADFNAVLAAQLPDLRKLHNDLSRLIQLAEETAA